MTTEGNRFLEEVKTSLKELIKRNNKMHSLRILQEQNQREFERVRERVQPPLSHTGHMPIRHASKIDISLTDPHMYGALEKAAMLTTRASVKGERATILAERAQAVVEAAANGSNRAMMALYRFSAEGDDEVQALVENGGIPVVIELVALGAGHGTAHESAEAMRHCLLAVDAMARSSTEAAQELTSGLLIGPLVGLLTMEFCEFSHVLGDYVDNDPAGPLEVLEESTRHVWMAVMAQSLRIIQHLCTANPDPAVAAAVAEDALAKCVEYTRPCDEDLKTHSRELRVECVHAMALLGRYDVAVERMEQPMVRLVECLADVDGEVQFAAAQGLINLLDRSVELLPSMLPPAQLAALVLNPTAALSPADEPIQPYRSGDEGLRLGREEHEGGNGEGGARGLGEGVHLPPARGAVKARYLDDEAGSRRGADTSEQEYRAKLQLPRQVGHGGSPH